MSSSPIDEADVPVIGTGAGGSAGAGSGSSGSSLGPHSAAAEYSLASPVTSEAGSAASGSPVPDAKEYGTEQHAFEGPEKVLEIDFVPRPSIENDRGCRLITRDQWDTVLTAARASILCSSSNDHLDSYVLSESSLFVYAYKVIIKTCGTTTLLHAVEPLLAITRGLGMEVEWVGYTRKNFEHPADQVFPHSNFNNEVRWLKDHFPEGHAYVLGPITDDHWFIFVADYITRTSEDARDRTLDVRLPGLADACLRLLTCLCSTDHDVRYGPGFLEAVLEGSFQDRRRGDGTHNQPGLSASAPLTRCVMCGAGVKRHPRPDAYGYYPRVHV